MSEEFSQDGSTKQYFIQYQQPDGTIVQDSRVATTIENAIIDFRQTVTEENVLQAVYWSAMRLRTQIPDS
jgi:hypothetical protein